MKYNRETDFRITVEFADGRTELEKFKIITEAAASQCGFKWYAVIIKWIGIHKGTGLIIIDRTRQMDIPEDIAVAQIEKATSLGNHNYIDILSLYEQLYTDYDRPKAQKTDEFIIPSTPEADKEKQIRLFKEQIRDEYHKDISSKMGYCVFDLHNRRKNCPTSMPGRVGDFELESVLPSPNVTRLLYKYVPNSQEQANTCYKTGEPCDCEGLCKDA